MNGKKEILPIIISAGVALAITGAVKWFKLKWPQTSERQSLEKKELVLPDIPLVAKKVVEKGENQILVVAHDLKKDSPITLKNLVWKKWPHDAIQPSFIAKDGRGRALNNKSDYDNALKMWAASDILAGVPLTIHMLTSEDPKKAEEKKKKEEEELKKKLQEEKAFSFIKKGMRAVTFSVDQKSASSSRMLSPEDLVDVLIIEQCKDKVKSHKYSALKILAIDGITKFENKKSDLANKSTTDTGLQPPKNVTLEVKEEIVEEMLRLVGHGGIILSLRNQAEEIKEEVKIAADKVKKTKDEGSDNRLEDVLLKNIINIGYSAETIEKKQMQKEDQEKYFLNIVRGSDSSQDSWIKAQNQKALEDAKLSMMTKSMITLDNKDDRVKKDETNNIKNDKTCNYEIIRGKVIGEEPIPETQSAIIYRGLRSYEVQFDDNGIKATNKGPINQMNGNSMNNLMKNKAGINPANMANFVNPAASKMNLGI
ncbi:MAG: SAF domain-containing protein [Holosporaceae bacterium]|jgi:Flp pilus assembly protein CpaB|nr:SAF domain-containing protein [Holosporaceae bacterium]